MKNKKRLIGIGLAAIIFILWVSSLWSNAYEKFGFDALWIVPIEIISVLVVIVLIDWLLKSKD